MDNSEQEIEHGENLEGHLLPDLDRLCELTSKERRELVELTRDWTGEYVERFRRHVEDLDVN